MSPCVLLYVSLSLSLHTSVCAIVSLSVRISRHMSVCLAYPQYGKIALIEPQAHTQEYGKGFKLKRVKLEKPLFRNRQRDESVW